MKKAIIVGHTGQDGTHLLDLLRAKEYDVIGISSQTTISTSREKLQHIDITQAEEVNQLIKKFQPDKIFYLAAVHQSSADKEIEEGELFKQSIQINLLSLVYFLNALKNFSPKSRLFYAASSHIFGNPVAEIQDENTPLQPICIYGITKTAGLQSCRFYREEHNIFASVGIFYNHESPIRSSKFVSQKIVRTAVAIKHSKEKELILGNLKARIDWGYAADYVQAAYQILEIDEPDDFVISSGEIHTVEDFVQGVFEYLDLDWKKYVKENPALITKKSKRNLFGNNAKLKMKTGWHSSASFNELIKIMVDAELKKYEQQ